jgi:hypothetical protein
VKHDGRASKCSTIQHEHMTPRQDASAFDAEAPAEPWNPRPNSSTTRSIAGLLLLSLVLAVTVQHRQISR